MHYIIAILLLAWIPFTIALEPVEVGDLTISYSLNDHVEYIIDPPGERNAEQLLLENHWLSHNKETLSFGYTSDTYWFRFKINNDSADNKSHLFEISYPVLDDIQIYIYDKDKNLIRNIHLGDKKPFYEREVQHRNFLVPLEIDAHDNQVWMVRVKTSSAMQVPMAIWKERAFFITDQAKIMGMGLYYGIMLIMILYNLVVFFSVREKSYLFYVFYVASMAGFLASLQGLNFQYVWPMATNWNDSSIVVMLAGVVVFACLFARDFLALKSGHKALYNLFGLATFLAVIIIISVNFLPYYLLIKVLIGLAFLVICLVTYTGILRWSQGFSPARFFTIAWSSMLLGGAILALNKFNIIPRNYFTENAVQLGSAIEVILLSFALADRLNQEKRDRYEAQVQALGLARTASNAQAEALEQERNARNAQEKALVHEKEAREAQARALEIQRKANETLEDKVRERTNELELVNEKLEKLSTTDALTGVRNRRYFDEAIEFEFNRASRGNEQLAILMLDIDHFKKVNDDYGHQIGDEALRKVASVLRKVVNRTTDIIARYGGEEFAIVLPATDLEGAVKVAEKIRVQVSEIQLDANVEGKEITFSITMSIGIMGDAPNIAGSDGYAADINATTWLKEADDALYTAKEEGRNRVILSAACTPKKTS